MKTKVHNKIKDHTKRSLTRRLCAIFAIIILRTHFSYHVVTKHALSASGYTCRIRKQFKIFIKYRDKCPFCNAAIKELKKL